MTAGDKLLRHTLNRNGYYLFDLPDTIAKQGNTVVTIPMSNGSTVCVDTATDQVYKLPSEFSTNNTFNSSTPTNSSNIGSKSNTNYKTSTNNTNNMKLGLQMMSIAYPDRMEVDITAPSSMPSWSQPNPTLPTVVREGIRVLLPSEWKNINVPDTPTTFDADSLFNDHLYLFLLGDPKAAGSSVIDSYLTSNGDTRMKMYLDTVIDNQGCSCELHATDLDKYLYHHKNVNSAIALRATLTEKTQHLVAEGPPVKKLKQISQKVMSAWDQARQELEEYGRQLMSVGTPWDARSVDNDLIIG